MSPWIRALLFLPPESSSVAASIDHLHFFVIGVTMAGSAFVGLLALVYVIRYRRRAPLRREVIAVSSPLFEWGLAGGLFALFIVWWVIGFHQFMRIRVPPENTYDVYVTAKQWMWQFSHRDGRHSIARLTVPSGRPVRLIMTSRDVIHSFYVPDFRLKQDVLPGRYTTLWFTATPGHHELLCAEMCGPNHSTMRGEIVALEPAEFARWLARGEDHPDSAPPFTEEPSVATELGPSHEVSLVRLGEEIAAQEGCLRCHTLDGSPHIGPTFAGLYRSKVPLEGGGTVIADEAYLTESMMDPNDKIRAGFKSVMPSYLGRLRPAETAALIELIRSLEYRAAPGGQGLPPPGTTPLPPMNGTVEVGPQGQKP